MDIRKLKEADLAGLAALYRQFWGEESSLEKMRLSFRRLSENTNYVFLCAMNQDRLVGSVMGIICEELYGDCKPFMVIEDVIVDKRHRRGNIGSSLMSKLEEIAIERGCSYIIFVTESVRKEAIRFYESLGYHSDVYKGFKKRLMNTRAA